MINAWAMYDWANSVYSLTITSAIFPVFYLEITRRSAESENNLVSFFGRYFDNVALLSYGLAFAFLVAALIAPLLSGIADYTGNKKRFMKFFCYLGSAACASMFFFKDLPTLEIGVIGYILASIGWTGSIVFYNAFLPEIADEADQDRVSAKGYALGYIGSIILLVINILMIEQPAWFGLHQLAEWMGTESTANVSARISFLTVGVWWAGFAQITFARLPKNVFNKQPSGNRLLKGYRELRSVLAQLKHQGRLKQYLVAFFFYSMGLQTVMYLAAAFGKEEIKMDGAKLILIVLIIQFIGVIGAYLFSYLSKIMGNLRALSVAVGFWILIGTYAYFIYTETEFIIAAAAVGMVMGGIQALSRSTYSKMLPATQDHASYFSFYDIAEKVAIVLGMFAFGYITEQTGSMRNSVIAIVLFFTIGLALLLKLMLSRTSRIEA